MTADDDARVNSKVDPDDRIISALADRILSEDAGLGFDDIPEMADLLTMNAFKRLCTMLGVCWIHTCDIEICIDDDRPCCEIEEN